MGEQTITILVVESDPLLRDLIRLALARPDAFKSPCQVSIAQDGAQALKILRKQTFDLLLLDILLPQMNGLDVLKRARNEKILGEQPVLLLSSLAYREVVEQAMQVGATDFIIKPFSVDDLILRINLALERNKRYRTI